MEIIAHRGLWFVPEGKNSVKSFDDCFRRGLGTETDFRDLNEQLVISHDIAGVDSPMADTVWKLYNQYACTGTLALNIKADGLTNLLAGALAQYDIQNYFVFDMSIPDTFQYRNKLKFFSRQSEVEKDPIFYDECTGIWLDAFYDESWITTEVINKHLDQGKKIAIVSPDLHKRDTNKFWEFLMKNEFHKTDNLILCTDKVIDAFQFFYQKEI